MTAPKTANGWGSVHNGGITGGAGGIEVSFSDYREMWIWMNNNKTTAAIITYTGPDVSFIGLPNSSPNSTFTNSSRFQIIGLQNKTIRASQGQLITYCMTRFPNNYNVIWENWRHKATPDDIIGILSDSVNIWVRHCEFDADEFNVDGLTDGSLDITLRSDFCAVTDCIFKNAYKTALIGSDNALIDDRGKLRVTYARNIFQDCVERLPLARFGKIGWQHNRVDTQVIPFMGNSKVIQVGVEAQIHSYENDYRRGRWLYTYSTSNTGGLGGVKATRDRIGTFLTNTTPVGPANVLWDIETEPNYTVDDWSESEMDAWLDNWAGATMHLMGGETLYTLTIQATAGGTASTESGGDYGEGATIPLTATANTGFQFVRWRQVSNDATVSLVANFNYIMPSSNVILEAVFEAFTPPPSTGTKVFRIP